MQSNSKFKIYFINTKTHYMKYANYLSGSGLLLSFIILFSACSTSFQAEKYQHYDYVKVPHTAPSINSETTQALSLKDDASIGSNEESADVLQPKTEPSASAIQHKIQSVQSPARADNAHARVGVATSAIQQLQSITNLPLQKMLNPGLIQKMDQQLQKKAGTGLSSLDPDLRKAIIFLIIGLILQFFWLIPDVGVVFGIIGTILIVIGLIYLLVYLLNS
jgi:hypothetical protein